MAIPCGDGQFVAGLEIHPEFGRGAKERREAESRVGGDRALLAYDLVYAATRDTEALSELALAQSVGGKKLLSQDLPGMDGDSNRWAVSHSNFLSMVVNDLDVLSASAPTEDDAPLVVDSDRVEAVQIAGEAFKAVSRGRGEILEIMGGLDEHELAQSGADEVRWKATSALRVLAVRNLLGSLVPKATNHCNSVTPGVTAVNCKE